MWNESERFWLNDLFQDIIHFLYPSLVNANVSIEKTYRILYHLLDIVVK